MDLIERRRVLDLINEAVAAEDQKVIDEEPKATANETKMYGFRYAAEQIGCLQVQVLSLPEAADYMLPGEPVGYGQEASLPSGGGNDLEVEGDISTRGCPDGCGSSQQQDTPTATEEVSSE